MGKQRVKLAPIFRSLANDINSGKIGRFFIVESEPGVYQVLQALPNNIAIYSNPQAVESALLKYLAAADCGTDYDLTPAQATQCVKYWISITEPSEMPAYLGEKNSSGLCFQRLPFNYSDKPKETLVIDDFMRRCSNASAIAAWIGSLTVADSSRFQYVWIYGSGGEGKGSFARGLTDIFGPGCVTMPVPKTDSQRQFMAYSLQGKRLCVFPECENFAFPKDPLFKQLTGGDHIWIEQKGKMGFSAPISVKFLFLSNTRPGIEGSDANLRRVIYSEVEKPSVKYSPGVYDSLIKAEMPSFIIKCRQLYLEQCPDNEDIQSDDANTQAMLDFNEEPYELLTEECVNLGAQLSCTPTELRRIQTQRGLSTTEYRNWIEYLRRLHGVENTVTWESGKSVRKWRGLSIKLAYTDLSHTTLTGPNTTLTR